MNERERFDAIMHYKPVDRGLLYDFNFWDETIPEWYEQGLPRQVNRRNAYAWFGLDRSVGGGGPFDPVGAGVNVNMLPAFEHTVIEDRGDHEVVQQADGVRVLRKKHMGSIPQHLGHLLKDRASWEEHYKPRLDPHDPRRLPAAEALPELRKAWQDPDRPYPITVFCGSLFGRIRDWMGMEEVSYIVYDDPGLFEEMVATLADVTVNCLEKIFAAGAKFEIGAFWEDMCFNTGPLLSPPMFEKFLVPQYQRITSVLNANGVDIIWVDCDGKIDELVPLWLKAGVNTMFPIEIGTWGADPLKFRAEYGRDLRLMGGVSKHVLAGSKDRIDAEVRRLASLVEEGGYIPMPDHRVPPDVPYENYVFYCEKAREVWAGNVDLPPIREIVEV